MFKLQRVPLQIDLLLIELEQFFNDYQWLHFRSIVLALLITPYKATLTGMVRVLNFGSHRSKHNEFLNDCSEILSKALKFYAMLVLNLLKKSGEAVYFIIDDTSNKKKGKHVIAAFKFFDHTSKQYIWGHQLVCAILEYRGIVIPYAIEVYMSKDKAQQNGKEFKKKTKIASEILTEFEADEGQDVFVVADTFYASPEIMYLSRARKYSFVSMLKTNRILNIENKQMNVSSYTCRYFKRKKNHKVVKLKSRKYQIHSAKVVLKKGGAVKIVCTRSLSHCTVKTIFTTNTALPIKSILAAYSKRWSIEVLFKMSKQYLGLRSYQSVNLPAIQSSVRLSLISYNLLTHVFIQEERAQGKRITDKKLAQFSVIKMRDHLRQIAMIDSIEYCLEHNVNKSKNKVVKEIKNMLIAA